MNAQTELAELIATKRQVVTPQYEIDMGANIDGSGMSLTYMSVKIGFDISEHQDNLGHPDGPSETANSYGCDIRYIKLGELYFAAREAAEIVGIELLRTWEAEIAEHAALNGGQV